MERAIAVAVHPKGMPSDTVARRLTEVSGLIQACGGVVVGTFSQARDVPAAGLGRGAIERLRDLMALQGASLAVLDEEFRPGVGREIEHVLGDNFRVIDRTQVILDIFANRARTREARVQVELAQYEYLEPRLKGHQGFSRLGGGIGTRGPGETRLEADRRVTRRRVADLKQELTLIEQQRGRRRQRRGRTELPLVALAGYTNVGKSTLFASLTHQPQTTADALFVTLDSTVRRILVRGFGPALIADTVGFVDRLPPGLVAAFRSTLAEIRDADLILEVVSGDPAFGVSPEEQLRVVREATNSLGCGRTPRLIVLSQSDRSPGMRSLRAQLGGVAVSGLTGDGLDSLSAAMAVQLARRYHEGAVYLRWTDSHAWQTVYSEFEILTRRDDPDGAELVLRGSDRAYWLLARARTVRDGEHGLGSTSGVIE